MNTFIEQMMELGCLEDRAASKAERDFLIKEAEELYDNHILSIASERKDITDDNFWFEKFNELYPDKVREIINLELLKKTNKP